MFLPALEFAAGQMERSDSEEPCAASRSGARRAQSARRWAPKCSRWSGPGSLVHPASTPHGEGASPSARIGERFAVPAAGSQTNVP